MRGSSLSSAGISLAVASADRSTAGLPRIDEHAVDAIFTAINQCDLPGAAIGIAIGGHVVYRKGFGLASMELPVLLTPGTRMRIGSSSKHFTALAWLLLCEDGLAALDDRIGRFVPELHAAAGQVTARQLLTHVSGLRDVFDLSWHFNGTGLRVSSEDLLSLYANIDDVNETPGKTWIYNNGGYLLLTIAIERITGHRLEIVLRDRLFAPVGMNDTLLRRWDTDFVPNSATLHSLNASGQFEKAYLGTAGVGQGGIVSTVDDMLRWLAHMDNPIVGSRATWETLITPQRLENGTCTGYALGLRRYRYRGVDVVSHSGGVMGGNCEMLKVPAARLDIVILVNRADVSGVSLAERVMDCCLPDLDPLPREVCSQLRSGTFRSRRGGHVVQLYAAQSQQMASVDGLDMFVSCDALGTLRPVGVQPPHRQEIVVGDDSTDPSSIELREFGATERLYRVEPPQGVRAPVGDYAGATGALQLKVVESQGAVQMKTTGPSGSAVYELQPLSHELWRARRAGSTFPPGGILAFDRNTTELSFWTFRNRALTFRSVG